MLSRYQNFSELDFDSPGEGILRITLNGADRLNAANATMHRELAEIWPLVDRDPQVRVAILTGAGGNFSAGGDFELLDELNADPQARLRIWREARDIVFNVINCSKPVVAAIAGVAVGAGLAAALVADITIAGRSARFIDGHTRLGVAAGDHAALVWPLLVSMAKAKYYLLTCEPLGGEEAERIGLISLCVEDDELDAKTMAVASRLAGGAQTAIRFSKYALNHWLRNAGPIFDASLAMEFLSWGGDEVQEGLASLREKRAPDFPKTSPI